MDRVSDMLAKVPPPGPNSVGCAKCCVFFASTGVAFLSFIGILLKRQPVYMVGIHDPAKAAKECFAAAWIYTSIVCVSIFVLVYDRFNNQRPTTTTTSNLPRAPLGVVPEYGAINYKNEL
ncbi:hypothetical protein CTAYLR_005793 [Chrysophaeum taylorii]|uniref:Uncharacterized protein n=1 Tax=Chrysophaeum taylorii TaxID=2483200 RepID=A0AAD7UM80_9STRA|nr:hypothetical protein CTAYLR_005793 [Chrysophaeum taylorii]